MLLESDAILETFAAVSEWKCAIDNKGGIAKENLARYCIEKFLPIKQALIVQQYQKYSRTAVADAENKPLLVLEVIS